MSSPPRRSKRIEARSTPAKETVGVKASIDTRVSLRSRSRSRPSKAGGMRSLSSLNRATTNADIESGLKDDGYDASGSGTKSTAVGANEDTAGSFAELPAAEKVNMLLLLVLYTLQGIPMGLAMSIPLILKERGAGYDTITMLSWANVPFSLKLLWAPLVDTHYLRSIGRRKTWLVPVQLLTGALLLWGSSLVVNWLGGDVHEANPNAPQALPLTIYFASLYFLMATQDVAVDGWALTMLSSANVGYASTCNTIGQALGAFLSNQGFISLSDATWCQRMLGTPAGYSVLGLEAFMQISGIFFIVVTLLVWAFKTEKPLPLEEEPESLAETYGQVGSLLRLPPVRSLLIILLTCKVAFAPADSVAMFKMQEFGMPKADIATFSPIVLVVGLVLPVVIATWVSRDPLNAVRWGIPLKMITTALFWLVVNAVPAAYADGGRPSTTFFAGMLFVMVLHEACGSLIFCAFMSFFNKVSDPSIGGTYMTFLNSVSNLGWRWSNSAAIWATGAASTPQADGYTIVTVACVAFGIIWMYMLFPTLKRLDGIRREDWWAAAASKQGQGSKGK